MLLKHMINYFQIIPESEILNRDYDDVVPYIYVVKIKNLKKSFNFEEENA